MTPGLGRILTVNAGSSSLKLRVLGPGRRVRRRRPHGSIAGEAELGQALAAILEEGTPVAAAGHRVVHGGPDFDGPAAIDASIEDDLAALADLAPLHNPPALAAIRALEALRPQLPAVACFDTSFHAHDPAAAAALRDPPPPWRERWPLRRYGFHGLSHAYAARRAAELLGRPAAELRLVIAHLGAGASLAAVKDGRSVETTMGFTPLEGLVMATRSGSVDPACCSGCSATASSAPRRWSASWTARPACWRSQAAPATCARSSPAPTRRGHIDSPSDVYHPSTGRRRGMMAAAMGGLDALVFTGAAASAEHAPRVRAA